MATKPVDGWIVEEESTDLPPPEPAPADWARPVPVETRMETGPGVEVETEERELAVARQSRARRFWITTAVYLALWLGSVLFVRDGQGALSALIFIVPLYLLTLPFVLRLPKKVRGHRRALVDRMGFYSKLMTSVAVFLAVYLPFTIFSNAIIPFAALVEYGLFTLLIFVLLRLGVRSVGVSPSIEALPPPSHRLHQQVVAPIDDAHYQKTLWLNYSFVEKARGGRQLAKRIEEALASNGVDPERRVVLLAELNAYDERGHGFFGGGRERREQERERRARMLDRLFSQIGQEMEFTA